MNIFQRALETAKKAVQNVVDSFSADKQLEKAVTKFNEKVERVREVNPNKANAQPRTQALENFEDLSSRDKRRVAKHLKEYLKEGAEETIKSPSGAEVSKWYKEDIAQKVEKINAERKAERERIGEIDATSRGEELGLKRKEMGSERINELLPKKFDFDTIKGGKEWEKYVDSVERQVMKSYKEEQMELYKQNYIKSLESNYGEHAREIVDIIKDLPAKVVVETYYKEQEATITFNYSPTDMNTRLDILTDIWVGVMQENFEKIHG